MDPQIDPVTGERHGSLVRVIELQQIESSFDSQEDRKEALESVVERAISAGGAYCPRHYEEKAASYVEAFETAEKEAEVFIRAEQARADKLYNERREEKVAKKVARVRAIFDLFEEYLADCPRKELAMTCTWREDDLDCLKFNCTIVEQAMRHLVSAPVSRVTFRNLCYH
jgi:murein L,D-transpeptidase YcbB/YkuD